MKFVVYLRLLVRKEFSAGFIVFKRTRGGVRYLLLRHGGNYWNFPKGHIEKDETELRAAFRETREEAGLKHLTPILGFKHYAKYFFWIDTKARFKLVVYFLAEASPQETVRISSEHEAFGWFAFAEATKMFRYRESQQLLLAARQFLKIGCDLRAQKIYALTQKIPKGRVSTYGEIARAIGRPKDGRFVGLVLHQNTDSAIPCHRVVLSDGALGGYNKGVLRKAALLKKEGIMIQNNRIDLARFGQRIRA